MSALHSKDIKKYLLKKINIREPKVFSFYTYKTSYLNNISIIHSTWDLISHIKWLSCLLLIELDIKIKCYNENKIVKCQNGEYEYSIENNRQYNFRVNKTIWTKNQYLELKKNVPTKEFFYFILLKAEEIVRLDNLH
jgi:hypothetical protein